MKSILLNGGEKRMKKKNAERIVVGLSLVIVVALFLYFLKDVMIPLFGMELHGDLEGAKSLLLSRGVTGGLSVILIEALQMVVVFIPAEFIQVSAGLSYPFWLAMILCDLGVCLGATIIYVLVHTFRFSTAKVRKSREQIDRLSEGAGSRGAVILMYLLFITPIIPFGAICYYGSSTNLKYRRYILTVATGVIPSIITSNLIGASAKAFIMNALPLWLLVLIILFLMGILFVLLWLVTDKIFFKGKDGTPDSATYYLLFKIGDFLHSRKRRLHIDNTKLEGVEGPFVLLCNHASFFDPVYVKKLLGDINPSYVINNHYVSTPLTQKLCKKAGLIPKKLFYPDTAAIKIIRTLKKGYSVVVFPEGRLSVDGRNYPLVENAARIYKKQKVTLVLAKISGAYFSYPKWRGKFFPSDINISVERVITGEEMAGLSVAEVERIIDKNLAYDDSAEPINRYTEKDKAKGLETVLYRCVDCGALYTTACEGDDLVCTACGARHHLDESYRFTDEIGTISAYYDRIRTMEREKLDSVELFCEVDTKVFTDGRRHPRKERGACTLTKDAFSYRSNKISFTIPTAHIPAIAFSCDKEFELYYKDELYYFYPVQNRRQAARWALIADLLYEVRNEKNKEKNAD
jgi:uncharacterized membrane protein YdjX (TVP38/TMEM64 family)